MRKHLFAVHFTPLIVMILLGPPSVFAQGDSLARQVFDGRVDAALRDIIDLGADMYNNGDAAGCCRLFEGALVTVRPFLDHRPTMQRYIADGLASARGNPKTDERAFALRKVIDKVREELKPAPVARVNPPPVVTQPGDYVLSAEERDLLDLTNRERAKEGLQPLRINVRLSQAARGHSANMAKQEKMAHELDGEGPGERIRAVGYRGFGWGENIAAGQRSPASAVADWMTSEGHRANILNPQYNEIGVGIAGSPRTGLYYTQVFGINR